MSTSDEQLSLFEPIPPPESNPAASVPVPLDQARRQEDKARLNAHMSLAQAVDAYRTHMEQSDLSPHTIKSFIYDLNILIEFAGASRPIGQIARRDLENFMNWLVNGRGVPCNAKSLSRRLTTLKAFFRWLNESGAIDEDPAAPIAHKPVSTPLPDILTDEQIRQVLSIASQLRHDADKPDARPYVLVSLLLQTGIKKSECMAIHLDHIDLSDPNEPALWIRYNDPRHQHKERKLKLDPKWPRALEEYKAQYGVADALFTCTARRLEYLLADMGKLAGLPRQLSFEMLRWTCAVRDRRGGMPEAALRQKLGLSEITWHDTWPKIEKLAAPAL